MPNSIAAAKNYTAILDEVYQRETVSTVLNSPRRLMRAGRNAKEIMIPKISVTGLGDYTRIFGYKTIYTNSRQTQPSSTAKGTSVVSWTTAPALLEGAEANVACST